MYVCDFNDNFDQIICVFIVSLFNTAANVDECQSDPCENGGQCDDDVNGYTCQCADGYTDIHCQGKTYFGIVNFYETGN